MASSKPKLSTRPASARSTGESRHPCIGLESEFTVYVDDEKQRPEEVFRNPRFLVREKMIPRPGRSWHLPSGGALYFDTGVVEVATPVHEIGPGCAEQAVRSLWDQIEYVRTELNAWEATHGVKVRLEGFSAHYNVSVTPNPALGASGTRQLALLLTYLLHTPVMLLAANRFSTGVGVRPRDGRVEITADFTPDPELMTAATALITGVALAVAEWPDHRLEQLLIRGFPVITGFKHRRHTSRKGFLARFDCFPANPFATDPNLPVWTTNEGDGFTLRQIARQIATPFRKSIEAVSSRRVVRHIFAVLAGGARSLLDFPERPPRYADVGRTIDWRRRSHRELPRSRYERIIHRVITHQPIRVGSSTYQVDRMLGWFEVAFRDTKTGRRRIFTLDELAKCCAV